MSISLFAVIGKIPQGKALIQQLLVTGHALYVLFKPEIDELVGDFVKRVTSGESPHVAAAISTHNTITLREGALTIAEEMILANRLSKE